MGPRMGVLLREVLTLNIHRGRGSPRFLWPPSCDPSSIQSAGDS